MHAVVGCMSGDCFDCLSGKANPRGVVLETRMVVDGLAVGAYKGTISLT